MGLFGRFRKALKKLGGAEGDAEALQGIKSAAIVSVTMDLVGEETDHGGEFSQRLVDYLAEKVRSDLGEFGWEITDYTEISGNEELLASVSLKNNEELRAELGELFDKQEFPVELPGEMMGTIMMAMMKGDQDTIAGLKDEAIDAALGMFGFEPVENERIVTALGLPTMSYAAFNPEAAGGTVTFGGGNKDVKEFQEKMRAQAFAGMAKALGVDAIIFVYAKAAAEFSGNINVLVEDETRIQGTIRMNSTVVIITADGEVALDAGYPGLSDADPFKRTPIYRNEEDRPMDLLHEPVWVEFSQLADKAAGRIVGNIKLYIEE